MESEHTFGEAPDCRFTRPANPHHAALALMQADLRQNLRADSGKPLAFHQLIALMIPAGIGISAIPTVDGLLSRR